MERIEGIREQQAWAEQQVICTWIAQKTDRREDLSRTAVFKWIVQKRDRTAGLSRTAVLYGLYRRGTEQQAWVEQLFLSGFYRRRTEQQFKYGLNRRQKQTYTTGCKWLIIQHTYTQIIHSFY
jgi:hypothetical protein